MNCAEFERGLARVIAEEPAQDERRRVMAALLAHTTECASCAGSSDLVELLGASHAQRDIADDPGPEYWSGFEDRLARRLPARSDRKRGSARYFWVAAAVIALALVAGSLLRGPADSGPGEGGTRRAAEELASPELPASLVSSVSNASVEEVEDQLSVLEGWYSGSEFGWGDGTAGDLLSGDEGLFPDVEGLDAETREQLLDWLRDENSRLEGAKG